MNRVKTAIVSLGLREDRLIFLSLTVFSFAVSFSFEGSQLLTGSLVNFILFTAAWSLPVKLCLPLVVMPSLGVLARGLIFGPLTPFLLYFFPFIWLGNLIMILVFKKRVSFLGVFWAALIKSSWLFFFARTLFQFKIVPAPFLGIMGINQLITACLGGFLALFIFKRVTNGKI